jgi:hypothetical protein
MGALHSEVVHDFIRNRKVLAAAGTNSKDIKCEVAEKLARKYAPKVSEHAPITQAVVAAAEAERAKHGCRGPSGLSEFASDVLLERMSAQLSMFFASARQDGVSGAFANYEPQLEHAYDNANTPSDVASASWVVVDQASADGIGQADLEVLAGLASISASSASDWYAFQQSGGTGVDKQLMSLFQGGAFWKRVGVCDLMGAFIGALAGNLAGAVTIGFIASAICAAAGLF